MLISFRKLSSCMEWLSYRHRLSEPILEVSMDGTWKVHIINASRSKLYCPFLKDWWFPNTAFVDKKMRKSVPLLHFNHDNRKIFAMPDSLL